MGFQDRDYNRYDTGSGYGGGGMRRSQGGFHWPAGSVVSRLIIINAIVFILDSITRGSTRGDVLAPSGWASFTVDQGIKDLQIWRWITYQFVHAGFGHVFFNMLGLYFFGPMVERWWGSRRFLAFYLLCGVSGAAVAVVLGTVDGLISFPPTVKLVGASGSLFGILMACAVLFPHQRVMLIFPPIPMTMRTMAMLFLGVAALTVIAGGQNAGGEAAHLGGAALGFLLVRNPRLLDWADRSLPRVDRGGGRWQKMQVRKQRDSAEVDRILIKVKEQGLQALSRSEKRTLQQATERRREPG